MKIIVTGGMGFIGSALVRHIVNETTHMVINVDKLTYAANPASLVDLEGHPRYRLAKLDICDRAGIAALLRADMPDAVINLAAESHVDRSIDNPGTFLRTNVDGTFNLLNCVREYWMGLPDDARSRFRFHQVSTDEVYGALGAEGLFLEDTPYAPNSPYAASKAAADHLVLAWHATYGLPAVISNCTNNYGPRQFPEKLIPLTILNALEGAPLPIYGDGTQVRDWLHVEDHARALVTVLARGAPGRRYNIGARCERRNIDVVRIVCDAIDGMVDDGVPALDKPRRELITHVDDRPGHDRRYALDVTRIDEELGWRAEVRFETGLTDTVQWYLRNRDWWRPLRDSVYDGTRLGLGALASHASAATGAR